MKLPKLEFKFGWRKKKNPLVGINNSLSRLNVQENKLMNKITNVYNVEKKIKLKFKLDKLIEKKTKLLTKRQKIIKTKLLY